MNDTTTKQGMIAITEVDLHRLRTLIAMMRTPGHNRAREYLDQLENELDRAEVVMPQAIPQDVITMRSRVCLRDVVSGDESVYALVFPHEADVGRGKISVLAPIGTAMIGTRVGETIEWPVPAGLKRFRVEAILYQPERAGDYHL